MSTITHLYSPFSDFQPARISQFPGSDVLAEPGVCNRTRLSELVCLLLTWYQTSEDPEPKDSNTLRELAAQISWGKKNTSKYFIKWMSPAYLRHRGKNCSLLSWLRPRHLRIDLHHTNWGELKKFIHLFIYSFIWCVYGPITCCLCMCVSKRTTCENQVSPFIMRCWELRSSGLGASAIVSLTLGDNCKQVYCYSLSFSFFSTDTKNSRRYLSHQNLTNSMYPNILILKKVRFDCCFPLYCACVPDAL